jgi:hypothetical protein
VRERSLSRLTAHAIHEHKKANSTCGGHQHSGLLDHREFFSRL